MRLAERFGWTELVPVGGDIVLGRPPEGSPHSRDQAAVPNWAGDFNACVKLGLGYGVYPTESQVLMQQVYATRDFVEGVAEAPDVQTAYRHVMLFEVMHRMDRPLPGERAEKRFP